MQTITTPAYSLVFNTEWERLNHLGWDGRLQPILITDAVMLPWGRAIGYYEPCNKNEIGHITIKRSELKNGRWRDVLLHEMIHQFLHETGQNTEHNDKPWCNEIMRLGYLLWGATFWASPSEPRRVAGESVRIQKPSPTGEPSISRRSIAGFPYSLNLHVDNIKLRHD